MMTLKASGNEQCSVIHGTGQTGTGSVTTPTIQLAPSDHNLLGPMKKMLGGQKFASDIEVQSTVRQWLRQQSTSFFLHQAFRNLLTDGINVKMNLDGTLKN